jgi:hypothetical protein
MPPDDDSKLPLFTVRLTRTVVHHYNLQVHAASEQAARSKALNQAGDINFHDGSQSDPDYGVEEVYEGEGP